MTNEVTVISAGQQGPQGIAGGAGPNNITTATTTPLTGVLYGGGGNVHADPSITTNGSGALTAVSVAGSGASLTGLNASNIASGTVADARLTANIAKVNANNNFSTNQSVTGDVTVTGIVTAYSVIANTFQVNTASPSLTIDADGNLSTNGYVTAAGTVTGASGSFGVMSVAGGTFFVDVYGDTNANNLTVSNVASVNSVTVNGGACTINNAGEVNATNVTVSGVVIGGGFAAVARSGDYNDLSNQPSIPMVPSQISAFTNDVGYITGYPTNLSSYANDVGYITGYPTNLSSYNNDVGFITTVNDGTSSNLNGILYGTGMGVTTLVGVTTDGSSGLSVTGALSVAGGNMTVEGSGNVHGASGYFTSVYCSQGFVANNGMSNTFVVDASTGNVTAAGVVTGASGLFGPSGVAVNGMATFNAGVSMGMLPTSDPMNSGQLWNDAGTLKISA